MAAPTVIGMTQEVVVSDSYIVRLTALDPTTGAVVSAVKVSGMAISARNLAQQSSEDGLPPPLPLLVPSDDSL